ncbi:MAG: hypothetical protein ACYC63_12960 [Armatimonadota bacterium]
MECTFDLDEPQVKLLLDMLERERRELHAEIRHTDNRDYRHELHRRLESVEGLAAQLETQVKVPAGQV